MKRIITKYLLIILLMLPAFSCKKFLETQSQNNDFLKTAQDLDELLIGNGYTPSFFGNGLTEMLFIMDDDVEENPVPVLMPDQIVEISHTSGYYNWQPNPYSYADGAQEDNQLSIFIKLYKSISTVNTVIFNVPLMRKNGEPGDVLTRVNGEAHFLRGLYYFLLVNTYGKPYNKTSASTDYGVPLKTDPAIESGFFSRATVQQVYDQVINDLLQAEKDLAGYNERSVIRANQSAVQALLSRVYLYMEEYEKSASYADKILAKNYQILNLNNFDFANNFLTLNSPETIFNMGEDVINFLYPILGPSLFVHDLSKTVDAYRASDNLVQSFETDDLRPPVFFDQGERPGQLYAKVRNFDLLGNVSEIFLIRLPEIYLNKSEALAVLGRHDEAINLLQQLRRNRFAATPSVPPAGGEALVNFIREERRRELCFEGHRWFDLRRYAVNSKYPFSKTIRHNSYAYNGSMESYVQGYYELKPYSQDAAAYVVPLHPFEIAFNRETLTNEPRPSRPMIK
jgi:tetratricopeptide (TPR) repeat protein